MCLYLGWVLWSAQCIAMRVLPMCMLRMPQLAPSCSIVVVVDVVDDDGGEVVVVAVPVANLAAFLSSLVCLPLPLVLVALLLLL